MKYFIRQRRRDAGQSRDTPPGHLYGVSGKMIALASIYRKLGNFCLINKPFKFVNLFAQQFLRKFGDCSIGVSVPDVFLITHPGGQGLLRSIFLP